MKQKTRIILVRFTMIITYAFCFCLPPHCIGVSPDTGAESTWQWTESDGNSI